MFFAPFGLSVYNFIKLLGAVLGYKFRHGKDLCGYGMLSHSYGHHIPHLNVIGSLYNPAVNFDSSGVAGFVGHRTPFYYTGYF